MTIIRSAISSLLSTAARSAAIAIVAGTSLIGAAAAASAAGLIEPLSAAERAAAADTPLSPYAIRGQLVAIDYRYLEANLVPRGIDRAADRLDRAPAAGLVRLELFPDVALTFRRTSLDKAHGGGFIWTGAARGKTGGFATLVINGDRITAQIQVAGRVYRIAPVAGGLHQVSQIDPRRFPGDIVVPAPVGRTSSEPPAARGSNPEAKTVIRVLIPYTPAAATQSGDIGGDANLAIALANQSVKNGGAAIKYKLAGKIKVTGYTEASFSTDLNNLSTNAGAFKKVHKRRNKVEADLVAMLRGSGGGLCGIGWYIEKPTASTSQYGFTVTSYDCVTNHSVAHEMGHNSGLNHDRYQYVNGEGNPNPPKSKYNFGYTNLKADIRSVMAYNTECADKQADGFCPRVPMFSSTAKKYNGAKLGIPKGTKNAADASRRLNETKAGVAKYR